MTNSRTTSRSATPVVVVVVLTIFATLALAQPNKTSDAAAEALFQEAVTLRRAGLWQRACKKFRESQKLSAAGGTLLNVAECYERFGDIASAWRAYKSLLTVARAGKVKDRLAIAKRKLRELAPLLPRVMIKLGADAKLPGLRVMLNGKIVGASLEGVSLPVDSGEYVVEATAPGHNTWKTTLTVPDRGIATTTIPKLASEGSATTQSTDKRAHGAVFPGQKLIIEAGLGGAYMDYGESRSDVGFGARIAVSLLIKRGLSPLAKRAFAVTFGGVYLRANNRWNGATNRGNLTYDSLSAHVGVVVSVVENLGFFYGLSIGTVFLDGLGRDNPFTIGGDEETETLTEQVLSVTVGAMYRLTDHTYMQLTLTGARSPSPETFRPEYSKLNARAYTFGIGTTY